jgi:hypothetical protein
VVGGWNYVGEIKCLLIGDAVWDFQKVGVAEWAADIFCLTYLLLEQGIIWDVWIRRTSSETTCEMGISEKTSKRLPVKLFLNGGGIRGGAHGG